MLLKPLAFAATAAAFLVIPSAIKKADEGVFRALPVHAEPHQPPIPATAKAQSIDVPFPHHKHQNRRLRLDLTVEDGTRLLLNGFELFPNADPFQRGLPEASVIAEDGQEEPPQRLGYTLMVHPVAADSEQGMELIMVKFKVVEIGGHFVSGMPAVKIKLIKAATDDIAIGSVVVKPTRGMKCWSPLSRLIATMKQHLASLARLRVFKGFKGFKGCGGHRKHHGHHEASPTPAHDAKATFDRVRHRFHHNWRQLLRNIASHIFLPALMGLAAGVGVAAFAMVLCSATVRLTRFAKRRYSGKDDKKQPQVHDFEKARLLEETEAEDFPPFYQDEENTD